MNHCRTSQISQTIAQRRLAALLDTAARSVGANVLYLRFHPVDRRTPLAEESYSCLLSLLGEITPVVEALPPDAAFADVRGSLRYFGRTPAELGALIRVRALARYSVDCTIGAAANPLLARMIAYGGAPDTVRTLPDEPGAVAAFLVRRPVTALHGVGPATARLLCDYGLDSVGRIAAVPLSTLQRILGASAGRRIHEQARGLDPTPVTPNAAARSLTGERRFERDELDPDRHRRALLSLTEELGTRLRGDEQVAGSLTLTVRYADRSATTCTCSLPEPTAHTAQLTHAAYRLYTSLGLQRARVRSVALRAEGLTDAELAAHQLTFDPADDKACRIEEAIDRARARFGPHAVLPAALLGAA